MKKKLLIILCAAWLLATAADFALVTTCHRPLFCLNRTPGAAHARFIGLGYSFDVADNSESFWEIDAYRGFLLGREVCANFME